MLPTDEAVFTIAAVIAGTMLTRFLPFAVFPADKPLNPTIKYLGNVLPAAVIALLIVYSLKDTSILAGSHGLPELISIAVTILLHIWRRNMLLSIAGGTIMHMVLVQAVF